MLFSLSGPRALLAPPPQRTLAGDEPHRVLTEIPPVGSIPFIVLLKSTTAGQPQQRFRVRERADDIRAPLDF